MTQPGESMALNSPSAEMPLGGVVVVESGAGRAVAFAGRLLRAYGATVIRIDDGTSVSAMHDMPAPAEAAFLDAGKLSVSIPKQARSFRERIYERADIALSFVDHASGEAGVEQPSASCPVDVEISWFGRTGPWRAYLCDDFLAQHASGLGFTSALRVDDTTKEGPRAVPGHLAEMVAGLTAATAAVVALFGDRASGASTSIDISVAEAVTSFMRYETVIYSYGWGLPSRSKLARSPVAAPVFQQATADGYVDMLIMQEAPWRGLLDLLGNPSWGEDELFATHPLRSQYWDALEPLLQSELRRVGTDYVYKEGQQRGIAIAPVNTVGQAASAAQFAERGFFVAQPFGGQDVTAPGRPFALGPRPQPAGAPATGADNRRVLVDWLECAPSAVEALGVVL